MALPELLANSPTPGVPLNITTVGSAGITSTTATTISVNAAAPAILQAAGQFRIIIDNEIMLVTGGASTTTWTVVRGGSLTDADVNTGATHAAGAPVWHVLTAGALNALFQPAWTAFPFATGWGNQSGYTCQYAIWGGRVYLSGIAMNSAAFVLDSTNSTVGTLPAAAQPRVTRLVSLPVWDAGNSVGCAVVLALTTAGALVLYTVEVGNTPSGAANSLLYFDGVSFPL